MPISSTIVEAELYDPEEFFWDSAIGSLGALRDAANRMKTVLDHTPVSDPNWNRYATSYQIFCDYLVSLAGDLKDISRMGEPGV